MEIVNFLKENPGLDVTKREYSNYLLFKDRIIEMSMSSGRVNLLSKLEVQGYLGVEFLWMIEVMLSLTMILIYH